MQLQQLRYLIAAAESGSFRAAGQRMYVSQSSISVAIKDLEQETGVTVFTRTSHGITLTVEGTELIDYARAVIEQADLMEERYLRTGRAERVRLRVSSQHYSLVVAAFGDFAAAHDDSRCEFALHESYTNEIIRDVQEGRSDLGVIYLSNYNDRVIKRALDAAGLAFTSLFVATPHAIVGRGHPLAAHEAIELVELEPFYRFEQEQGMEGSSYYAEEPLAALPHGRIISVSDNGTLCTLIAQTDGYAIGTGAFAEDARFVSVPLVTDEIMNVGFIRRADAAPTAESDEFLQFLARRILAFEGPIEPSSFVCSRAF